MKSRTTRSFWRYFDSLHPVVQRQAKLSYQRWKENPYHPGLQFKCVRKKDNLHSVRIGLNFRALGIVEGDTVKWIWIGSHNDYDHLLSQQVR